MRSARYVRLLLPIVALALLGATVFAGCSGDNAAGGMSTSSPTAGGGQPAAGGMAVGAGMGSQGASIGIEAANDAWAGRPAFTRTSAAAEEAYAYALFQPQIVQWMPCYCGCATMGHRSNLDCYIKPNDGGPVQFEEHASYCDVCVRIALQAKQLIAQGASLRDARAAIDTAFAGTVPGTPTEVPPQ